MKYPLFSTCISVVLIAGICLYFSGCGTSSAGSSNPSAGGPGSNPAFGVGTGAAGQNTAAQFLYGTQIPAGVPVPAMINQQTGILSRVTVNAMTPGPDFAADSAIDPTGSFLYTAARNGLFAFAINRQTGMLTQVANSPFEASQDFDAVTMSQSGEFVYAYGGGKVFGFSIQAGTGQLAPIPGSPFAAAPPTTSFGFANRITVDETDKFLYVATSTGIFGYNIDSTSGALAVIAGSPFGTAPQPYAVMVTPSNQFLYESSLGNTNINGYTIDQNTGALTLISGSPFNAGSQCGSIASIDNMTMAPGGKFLFENCGSMSVNATSGALTLAANSVPGDWPVIDPSGKFLWALVSDQSCWHCDQGPVTYQVDANTGNLTLVPNSFFVMQNDMMGQVISLAITK
jgi:6-phosphogluconolactonase (cycloisomerase 2 family)